MEQAQKPQGVVNLEREIEIRRGLSAEFALLLSDIERGGLSVATAKDLDALVLLLSEVIETRKASEKQEKALKSEVRRHFTPGSPVLDLPSVVALVEQRERTDLDREAIARDFGQGFFEKYGRKTQYEIMTVKVK